MPRLHLRIDLVGTNSDRKEDRIDDEHHLGKEAEALLKVGSRLLVVDTFGPSGGAL